jgi:hypothetical protein
MITRFKDALQSLSAQPGKLLAQRDALSGYRESLNRMLMDMRLEPTEMQALEAQRRSMALDPAAVHRMHVEVVAHLVRSVLSDGLVTMEEIQAVATVGSLLGVQWAELPPNLVQTLSIAQMVMNISIGQLPALPPAASQLRQNPGEVVHGEVPVQILDEKVVRREYRGRSSGMSVRIAKGVSYRFGSTRGHSVPITAVVPIDQGMLSITNQRVVFIGQKKSFSVEWNKVLGAMPAADGVQLAFASRTKSATVHYLDPTYAEVFAALFAYYGA